MTGVQLDVNGRAVEVPAEEDDPLLWVLRSDLGLVGAKYGCGSDQCGACRVLVDGAPMASCQLACGDVGARSVETIEGLVGDAAAGAAVVEALLRHNAGQCGYCLPGIAVTLTAMARRGRAAWSREEVAIALDAHLCRCGSQPRILRAAMEVLGAS